MSKTIFPGPFPYRFKTALPVKKAAAVTGIYNGFGSGDDAFPAGKKSLESGALHRESGCLRIDIEQKKHVSL